MCAGKGVPVIRSRILPGFAHRLKPVINNKGDRTMKSKILALIILAAVAGLPFEALAYEQIGRAHV